MGSNNLVDKQEYVVEAISPEEIDQCIFLLNKLVSNGHKVFELPEDKRVALLKAAGQLSRPAKNEFKQRKKDAAKAAKRKMIQRDKHARKETGIRSAREAAILLRAGATVVATTRFPVDSALRFSKEEDFHEWGHRLKIHGLDLRHIPSVEIFCNFIEQQYERLDILINNAAQTVRRPAGFYQHLMKNVL